MKGNWVGYIAGFNSLLLTGMFLLAIREADGLSSSLEKLAEAVNDNSTTVAQLIGQREADTKRLEFLESMVGGMMSRDRRDEEG